MALTGVVVVGGGSRERGEEWTRGCGTGDTREGGQRLRGRQMSVQVRSERGRCQVRSTGPWALTRWPRRVSD